MRDVAFARPSPGRIAVRSAAMQPGSSDDADGGPVPPRAAAFTLRRALEMRSRGTPPPGPGASPRPSLLCSMFRRWADSGFACIDFQAPATVIREVPEAVMKLLSSCGRGKRPTGERPEQHACRPG